jgi:hypothetical protein
MSNELATKYKGIDRAAIEEEMRRQQERSSGNKVNWDLDLVRQAKLPAGSSRSPKPTRVRFLPPTDGMTVPWVSWSKHVIFSAEAGKDVFFNCIGRGCPGCAEADRLFRGRDKLTQEKGKQGRAKPVYAANVIFETWGGGPVPEDKQGVKMFEFGPGIYRGTGKNVIGGLLAILNEQLDFSHPTQGCAIEIEKNVDGPNKQMDTTYVVKLVQAPQRVNGVMVPVPAVRPLAVSEAEIDEILGMRHNLGALTRTKSADELLMLMAGNTPEKAPQDGRRIIEARTVADVPDDTDMPPWG